MNFLSTGGRKVASPEERGKGKLKRSISTIKADLLSAFQLHDIATSGKSLKCNCAGQLSLQEIRCVYLPQDLRYNSLRFERSTVE